MYKKLNKKPEFDLKVRKRKMSGKHQEQSAEAKSIEQSAKRVGIIWN